MKDDCFEYDNNPYQTINNDLLSYREDENIQNYRDKIRRNARNANHANIMERPLTLYHIQDCLIWNPLQYIKNLSTDLFLPMLFWLNLIPHHPETGRITNSYQCIQFEKEYETCSWNQFLLHYLTDSVFVLNKKEFLT